MDTGRKLFIYDRKEVGILALLGIGVALFAFTLGVHLGKKVSPPSAQISATEGSVAPLESAETINPEREKVDAQVKHIPAAVNEMLDQSLRDEVATTGLQVKNPKILSLPTKKKNESPKLEPVQGKYALQVGSFSSLQEAEPVLFKLNENGLHPLVKEVKIKGKGTWYRILVGNFSTVREAENSGKIYQNEKRIQDFVVINTKGK